MNQTRVLHGGGPMRATASKMLPKLPDECFVEAADIEDEARRAAEDGLGRLVVFATPDTLADAGVRAPLAEITAEMGGTETVAAEVERAGSIREAYELWEASGLVGRCGRELCRRVADDLESRADASEVAVQVVLLDPAAERMVGMYGRLRR